MPAMRKNDTGRKAKKNGRHQLESARLPMKAVKQTAVATKAGTRNVIDLIACITLLETSN